MSQDLGLFITGLVSILAVLFVGYHLSVPSRKRR